MTNRKVVVRDDDVLVDTDSFPDPEGRFRGVHKLIVAGGAHHSVGIVVNEIVKFPGTIEYIKDRIEDGTMTAEFHGLDHIDYARLTEDEIFHHIKIGQEVFDTWFGTQFKSFYTPWGGSSREILRACHNAEVHMADLTNVLLPQDIIGNPKLFIPQCNVVFIHWWAKGLKRLEKCLKVLHEA